MAEDSINEEVQTEEEVSTEEQNSEDTAVIENSDQTEQTSDDSSNEDDGDSITSEELDAMDDDQFTEYLNTGKRPTADKTKVVVPDNATSVSTSKTVEKEEKTQPVQQQNTQTPTEADYKAIYSSIFRPFKANGKEITPRSVDDVVSLMQMGANYTKKMQAMAPMKKAVESLNKANINEEELNFLIDVHNGDKEAIKKLLQKNNVDPMDLDLESTNYVPHNNIASDEDVNFRDVIEDIGQDNLPKVENIVTKKWDSESRKTILKNPDILRKLGEEVQLGRFDAIQTVLDEERAFGRYKGVSDLEAYSDIVTKYVNYMNQKQVYQQQQQRQPVQQNRSVQPTSKVQSTKAKAAPTRSNPNSRGKANLTANDIFSMSEEDFNKINLNDLYS